MFWGLPIVYDPEWARRVEAKDMFGCWGYLFIDKLQLEGVGAGLHVYGDLTAHAPRLVLQQHRVPWDRGRADKETFIYKINIFFCFIKSSIKI